MRQNLWIDGQWRESEGYTLLRSPFDGEVLAEVAQAGEAETRQAIEAAERAASAMARMPAHERSAILERVVRSMESRREELARLLTQEAAKPLKTARGEIARTIQTYRFAAMEATRIHGETIPMDAAPGGEGRVAYTVRKPIGVVGAITPFNFPFNLVAHKVGPALAAGNTVVLKPAGQTPLSALALGELFAEAGLPAGALNIIPGKGSVVGEALVADPRVKAITFTGSPEVGIALRNKAGLKRVTLELGSNSAMILDSDIELDEALIERCALGAFSFSGQVCISIQRIYVHRSRLEEFLDKFAEAARRLKVGDPSLEETDVSALIHPKEAKRIDGWVQAAVKRGARIVAGGRARAESVYEPTILTGVPEDEPLSCQEAFGPIVCVEAIDSIDEAIDRVNRSRYGLQAGLYTRDIHTAMRAADLLEVGGVMINDFPTFRVDHMPYGGVKESGVGREGIKYAIEELTELKLISIRL
ncbi:aldehyde dehydrogenase family protein [Cohnella thailandensis]|uniref:Aldehyde dehydrogenase family protein n=1 Tax=Cohnella thailandensis TaxID=557557 RepID=A0A841T2Q6_9BACL|nr:aldehyde dehydrogenase family protein [Cohnella thailandensis]MBB6636895.1 aldehyde dehydrogenase family protein [Cohnella thailandensis]MBP1973226.1 acyl-CoA reductase-like NAD-dependent aldehyde dehydrogenase [Cohnella thailandensis]